MKKRFFYIVIPLILLLLTPLTIALSQYFSEYREGLEIIAEELKLNETLIYTAPLTDYTVPFIENIYVSTILAGLIGVLVVYVITYIVARILSKRRSV